MKESFIRKNLNDPLVAPVHTCVPGRARFKICGLQSNLNLRIKLEDCLGRQDSIASVQASHKTGKVLICFNSKSDHLDIARMVSRCLADLGFSEQPLLKNQSKSIDRTSQRSNPKARQAESKPKPESGIEPKHTWHRSSVKKCLEILETSDQTGLSPEVAAERLARFGPNALPEPETKSKLSMFLDQFKSLPVALLGAAAGVSVITGGLLDAAIIAGVLVANSCIGFLTENQSEKAIQSLQKLSPPLARVRRGGNKEKIEISELVPGDILLLQPGTYVGADARIIQTHNLTLDESTLTGESLPVEKVTKALNKKRLPVAERSNTAFMGTVVTGGQGLAVVVATGLQTEFGQLQQDLVVAKSPRPPIEKKLARTGDQLVKLWAAVCGAVFFLGLLRGYSILNILGISISLAAAAVPEGLPASATTTFALGMKDMRQHGILIRRLEAVETLGSVQTICFDKTGTITRNEMEVAEIFSGGRQMVRQQDQLLLEGHPVDSQEQADLKQILIIWSLCSQVKINGNNGSNLPELIGSSTENALVRMALDQGIDVERTRKEHGLIEVRHRSQKSPIMSTLHNSLDGTYLHAIKGSPLEVLNRCNKQMKDGQLISLDEADRQRIIQENERMAQKAYRVLGTATRSLSSRRVSSKQNGFIWLGLVGLTDPLRDGVVQAIKAFHRAGIQTVMITGDQRLTAETLASWLDLSQGQPLKVMDASEMEQLSPEQFAEQSGQVHVFSRVSPSDKLKIVQALQKQGRIVAMTGDGINDGPALKAADVGIAMGDGGADVARDVADVILERDHLDSLIQAVKDGRTTYSNIRKSVHFFLSTNLSEIMLMSGSMALGTGAPLTSMQLLWINLISDIFPGLSLSMEPQEPDVLDQPPRDPKAPLLSRSDYRRMTRESGIITTGAMGAYSLGLLRYGPGLRAGSLAFHTLTLSQLVHAYSCRCDTHPVLDSKGPPSNPWLHAAIGGSIGLHLLTMLVPGLRSFLNLTPIGLIDIGVILGSTLTSLGINETFKIGQSVNQDNDSAWSLNPDSSFRTLELGSNSQIRPEPVKEDASASSILQTQEDRKNKESYFYQNGNFGLQ